MADDEHDLDLPLMSNSRDIHVHHYVLDLTCVFEEKTFKGSITLFCANRISDVQSEKLVTTKEQTDQKAHDSGDASLQNVLDQKSSDKDSTINVHTNMATESAASSVLDSLLSQEPTSRRFTVKQLHLYNASDTHISCSPHEMTSSLNKESVVLSTETENKYLNSLEPMCQKLEKQSSIFKTIMLAQNENPDTAAVDTPVSIQNLVTSDVDTPVSIQNPVTAAVDTPVSIQNHDTAADDSSVRFQNPDISSVDTPVSIHHPDTSAVDTPVSILSSHNSNLETIGKHELPPEKSISLPASIDISDLQGASENVNAYCSKNSESELESSPEINSLQNSPNTDFHMILDSWNILVDYVEEMIVSFQFNKNDISLDSDDLSKGNDIILLGSDIIFRESNKYVKKGGKLDEGKGEQICLIPVKQKLVHETRKMCIRISKPGIQHAQDFPHIIRIHFRTDPEGSSLKWTQDQDGNACVYTHGHWINNRSLFPSQDVPDTMATWESCIHVEPQYTVLMSGDQEPIVATSRCGLKSYYYNTEMEMPSSTLALAVGKWKEIRLLSQDQAIRISDIETNKHYLPCRLFSPSSLQKLAHEVLGNYIPSCMEASASFLGPHPFKRLDVLIVPYSFNSLGMASPSLMFLSQSVLSADFMMCTRVAHEMSHSWFGLLIGPQDWTEEWLSEGFCTYTQEHIHSHIMKWNEEERLNHFGIRDYLKYKVLKAELNNTDEMFHILRPNKGLKIMQDGSQVQYIKNGMNPEKGYMQVHYLKGYFLLKHLEDLVGIEDFHKFLVKFVQHFHGQLITSKDLLDLFFSSFAHHRLKGLNTQSIIQEWLDNPSMPKVTCCNLQEDNGLAQTVLAQVKAFREFGFEYKSLHWTKRRKKNPEDILSKLDGDQLVLFLEELLREEHIHHHLLSCLRSFYSLHTYNAEVLHRWCELIIKHKLQTYYQDVVSFLINHQAMGVYLFGELIISEDFQQKKLAESCFQKIASDMDTDVRATVHSMLYGT